MINKKLIFEDKKIRRVWHNGEWWFVLEDIVEALIDSRDAKQYIQKLKQRDEFLLKGWVQIVHTLLVDTKGGKQNLNCSNKKGIFRIIQSIPSKKAEPFKLWLAKVGSDRIDEIENPELAQNRAKEYYEKKGYPKDWIEKRLRGIAIRQDLTDEWKNRSIKEGKEFAILTNEISKETFGVSVKDHKKIKNLNIKNSNENLRDHFDDLELIFSMLGEKVATEITKKDDSIGFDECLDASKRGGKVAGTARINAEKEIGRKVISKNNYKNIKDIKIIDKKIKSPSVLKNNEQLTK
jgi:hypothetical protein